MIRVIKISSDFFKLFYQIISSMIIDLRNQGHNGMGRMFLLEQTSSGALLSSMYLATFSTICTHSSWMISHRWLQASLANSSIFSGSGPYFSMMSSTLVTTSVQNLQEPGKGSISLWGWAAARQANAKINKTFMMIIEGCS